VVLAGTQKSFPGPQGGVIYTNSQAMIDSVSAAAYPAVMSNHHLARLPALGIALLEMKQWGTEYAAQVIENSQTLAQALVDREIPVVGAKGRYTESHTVLINVRTLGSSQALGMRLQDAGIIVSETRLPESFGGAGLRLGTNELTRHGATAEHMQHTARLIADVLLARRKPGQVRDEVQALAESLSGFAYTWTDHAADRY
jgi:glycine hydroxymethyltransferase